MLLLWSVRRKDTKKRNLSQRRKNREKEKIRKKPRNWDKTQKSTWTII